MPTKNLTVPLRSDDRQALVDYLVLHGVKNPDDGQLAGTLILILREWLAGNVRRDGLEDESP